jgi:hypothetical protein
MRSAVLNTAGSIVSFRVGHQDGYQLAKDIFPTPDFLERIEDRINLRRRRFGFLSGIGENHDFSGWESLAQALSNLPPREFWFRRRGPTSPGRHRTFDMPLSRVTVEDRERIQALLDTSGSIYSRPKSEVRDQVMKHNNNVSRNNNKADAKSQGSTNSDSSNFWGV